MTKRASKAEAMIGQIVWVKNCVYEGLCVVDGWSIGRDGGIVLEVSSDDEEYCGQTAFHTAKPTGEYLFG